jgi:hypothetical protein
MDTDTDALFKLILFVLVAAIVTGGVLLSLLIVAAVT